MYKSMRQLLLLSFALVDAVQLTHFKKKPLNTLVHDLVSPSVIVRVGLGDAKADQCPNWNRLASDKSIAHQFTDTLNGEFKRLQKDPNIYSTTLGVQKLRPKLAQLSKTTHSLVYNPSKTVLEPEVKAVSKNFDNFKKSLDNFNTKIYTDSKEIARILTRFVEDLVSAPLDPEFEVSAKPIELAVGIASHAHSSSEQQRVKATTLSSTISRLNNVNVKEKSNISTKSKALARKQKSKQEELAKREGSIKVHESNIRKNKARQLELIKLEKSEELLKQKEIKDYNDQIAAKNVRIERRFEECKSRLRRRRRRSPGWGSFRRAFKRISRPVRKITAPIRHPIQKVAKKVIKEVHRPIKQVGKELERNLKKLIFKCRQKHQIVYPNAAVVAAIRRTKDDRIKQFNRERSEREAEMERLTILKAEIEAVIGRLNDEIKTTKNHLAVNKKTLVTFETALQTLDQMKRAVGDVGYQMELIRNNFDAWRSRMFDLQEDIASHAETVERISSVESERIKSRFLKRLELGIEQELYKWINMARISYLAQKL